MWLRKNGEWKFNAGCWIVPGVLLVALILIAFIISMVRLIYYADGAEGIMFAHRESLDQMLVHDEAGGETVSSMLTVQHDGKKLVVGIGHDVLKVDKLEFGDVISLQRAAEFFEADVSHAVIIAHKVVKDFDTHPPDVQIVMAALAFQLGPKGLRSFEKMLYAVGQRDYQAAAAHLLDSKLARDDSPNRAAREAKRLAGAK